MNIAIDARPINHHCRHGIFTYTEKLIYELLNIDKNNHYFMMFCSLRKNSHDMPGPENTNCVKAVLRVPDSNLFFSNWYLSKIAIPVFLTKKKCAVFHSTFDTFNLKHGKCRYVLTVHDLKSLHIPEDRWKQNLVNYARAVRRADLVIAVSHSTKNDIVRHFHIAEKKVRVVYEGVDDCFKKIERQPIQDILKKYGIAKKYFLTAGRVPRKNVERVIQAFAKLKYNHEYDLVLLGATHDCVLLPRYKQLIEEYKLGERVKLIPYIETSLELSALYSGAISFVFPSLFEGFGLPVLEAMACETPVITSNVSSLPEVGGDAALYVDPQSVSEIAFFMQKIAEDNTLRTTLIDKGRNRIKMFSWRNMAVQTRAIYKELAL